MSSWPCSTTSATRSAATIIPEIAAAILKPFVDDKLHWIAEHHGVFQGYYFFHHLGMNRDMREAFRGHEHFEDTARFCELYDQIRVRSRL